MLSSWLYKQSRLITGRSKAKAPMVEIGSLRSRSLEFAENSKSIRFEGLQLVNQLETEDNRGDNRYLIGHHPRAY